LLEENKSQIALIGAVFSFVFFEVHVASYRYLWLARRSIDCNSKKKKQFARPRACDHGGGLPSSEGSVDRLESAPRVPVGRPISHSERGSASARACSLARAQGQTPSVPERDQTGPRLLFLRSLQPPSVCLLSKHNAGILDFLLLSLTALSEDGKLR
jgi:hypothetical protein